MYQIRKCERVTTVSHSGTALLDPENFRNISIPYEGSTEEEFLQYLEENRYELDEIWEEIDEDTMTELNKLWEPEWTEYDNSAWHGEESWLELGEPNPEYSKYGGFETRHTTNTY